MSLIIRLMKVGKKGESKFRVVVKEKRDKRDGKAVELLGFYHKFAGGHEKKELKKERIKYWISVGAQVSPTVKKLIS